MAPIPMNVEDYERRIWRPDRDYVDGVAMERRLGLVPHGVTVVAVSTMLDAALSSRSFTALISVRARVRPDRFRCIDIALVRATTLCTRWIETPPVLCVDVLQGDPFPDVIARCKDYQELGCRNIWVLDPFYLKAWALHNGALCPVGLDEDLVCENTSR